MSKIERAAVRYFSELIDKCNTLEPDFATEDKKPITDGEVRIYSKPANKSGAFSNSSFLGKVDVQVKGKRVSSPKTLESFSLPIASLRAIQAFGGLLFIAVAISKKNPSKGRAYYAFLYEAQIDQILAKAKSSQQSKSFPLKRLPKKPEQLLQFVRFAHLIQEKSSFVELSDAELDNSIGLRLTTNSQIDFKEPQWFGIGGEDAVVEIKTQSGTHIPAKLAVKIIPQDYDFHPLGKEIISGTCTYQDARVRKISPSEFEIAASPSILLRFSTDSLKGSVSFNSPIDFLNFHKDLKFFTALKETGIISIGDYKWQVSLDEREWLEEVTRDFLIWDEISKAFEILDVDTSLLKISDFTPEVLKKLEPVVKTVLNQKSPLLDSDIPLRYPFKIGDSVVQLMVMKESVDSDWEVRSLTSPRMGQILINHKDLNLPQLVTPYELFDDEEMLATVNLNLSEIVAQYRDKVPADQQMELSTNTVLQLLRLADSNAERRIEFLQGAKELTNWQVQSTNNENLIACTNRWQVRYRLRELSENDLREIRKCKRSIDYKDPNSIGLAVALNILLDNETEADELLSDMSQDDATLIRSMPIFHLYGLRQDDYVLPTSHEEARWKDFEDKAHAEQIKKEVSELFR